MSDGNAIQVPEEYRQIATICKATEGEIGGRKCLVVDARALHTGLEVKTPFRDWLRRRITENPEFKDEIDYEEFRANLRETSAVGGRPPRNVNLALETAKRVSMAEGGATGAMVRGYFIWCEDVAQRAVIGGGADMALLQNRIATMEQTFAIIEKTIQRQAAALATIANKLSDTEKRDIRVDEKYGKWFASIIGDLDDLKGDGRLTFVGLLHHLGRQGKITNGSFGRSVHAAWRNLITKRPEIQFEMSGEGPKAAYSRRAWGRLFSFNVDNQILLRRIMGQNVVIPNKPHAGRDGTPDLFEARH